MFYAWAAGEFETDGRLDAEHVTQRAEAARQHRVARDEGLGLGLIEQDEQMAALGADIGAWEHIGKPAEICGRVEFGGVGFWRVRGRVAGCGALWPNGHGAALDEGSQAVHQAGQAAGKRLA